MKTGRFIVIEGTDGSGKGTHTELLVEWLKGQNIKVETFDFPQYGQPSAYFVEEYLNGRFGSLSDIGPYQGSLFYALDRYAASFKIQAAVSQGTTVLANRYVASNLGHQGSKLPDARARQEFYNWDTNLEYDILKIPRPDLNLVLHMPSDHAQKFVDQKAARAYLNGKKRDLHEASLSHLQQAEQTYLEICKSYPESFKLIECAKDGHIRSINDIQDEIRGRVSDLLAQ